jgi:hypothetical protein
MGTNRTRTAVPPDFGGTGARGARYAYGVDDAMGAIATSVRRKTCAAQPAGSAGLSPCACGRTAAVSAVKYSHCAVKSRRNCWQQNAAPEMGHVET